MSKITEEIAVALSESGFWRNMTHRQIAEFQLHVPLLCMPFAVFHEAVEKALGRPVYTHEFARDHLAEELLGKRPAPTFNEILEMIPADKRVIVIT